MLSAALLLPAPARAVSADHAYVLDGVTERVLFEKNAGERGLIASTTKIMTAPVSYTHLFADDSEDLRVYVDDCNGASASVSVKYDRLWR